MNPVLNVFCSVLLVTFTVLSMSRIKLCHLIANISWTVPVFHEVALCWMRCVLARRFCIYSLNGCILVPVIANCLRVSHTFITVIQLILLFRRMHAEINYTSIISLKKICLLC